MAMIRWSIEGNEVDRMAVRVRLAQARMDRAQEARAAARRDANERRRELEEETHRRRVGAAIRRAVREDERRTRSAIFVRTHPIASRRNGLVRCRRLETMARLRTPRPSHVGADGLSSFHFKWTGRGLGTRRRKRSHRYRAGEAVRHLRYICRAAAREIADGGLVSNIAATPDEIAGFFAALEALEYEAQADANVYVSVVVALPCELSSDERLAVLSEICQTPARDGLPFAAVLHAPDPNGSKTNYHAHIMMSLRPFERLGPLEFGFSASKRSELNDGAFIFGWRSEIASIMNQAMKAGGHHRRFTPLSDKDRGLPARSKASGKSGPGKTHHDRRAEDLELLRTERTMRSDLTAAILELRGVVTQMLEVRDFDIGSSVRKAKVLLLQAIEAAGSQITQEGSRRDALQVKAAADFQETLAAGRRQTAALRERLDQARPVPRPAVAHAQQGAPSRDPSKQEAIERALAGLESYRYLPLHRLEDSFELTRSRVEGGGALALADRFDAEPEIQAAYASKWKAMLDALRDAIEHAPQSPFRHPESNRQALKRDAVSNGLYAALLAAGDAAEVHDILQRGILDWEEREKRQARLKREEKEREAKLARQIEKETAEREVKLQRFIALLNKGGRGERGWTLDQENALVIDARVLAYAEADGRVRVARQGDGFSVSAMERTDLQIAVRLSASEAGQWLLGRIADADIYRKPPAAPFRTHWASHVHHPVQHASDLLQSQPTGVQTERD